MKTFKKSLLFLLLISMSAAAFAATPSKSASWQFALQADKATLSKDSTILSLEGIHPTITSTNTAPKSQINKTDWSGFLSFWGKGKNSFTDNPPTVVLTTKSDKKLSTKRKMIVKFLKAPVLDKTKQNATVSVKLLPSDVPFSSKSINNACGVVDGYSYSGDTWSFAVICDTRGNAGYPEDLSNPDNWVNSVALKAISTAIAADNVDLVLAPGDLILGNLTFVSPTTYYPLDEQYNILNSALAPITNKGIKIYPVRGNHETYDGAPKTNGATAPTWLDMYGNNLPQNGPGAVAASGAPTQVGFTYSFENKNAIFVCIDQYVYNPYEANNWSTWENYTAVYPYVFDMNWINSQLAENTKKKDKHVFVTGHAPAFQAQEKTYLGNYEAMGATGRNNFWKTLYDNGAYLYFCGHDHFYARSYVEVSDSDDDNSYGLQQIILGTSGACLSSTPGSDGQSYLWNEKYPNNNKNGVTITPKSTSQAANTYGYIKVDVESSSGKVDYYYYASSNVTADNPTWSLLDSYTYYQSFPSSGDSSENPYYSAAPVPVNEGRM